VALGTPLGASQADLDEIERIVREAGTSFYRGMRVLPPDRRHAMYAIYAFCRIVDDIADEAGALADKLHRLSEWRVRVAGLYRGEADGAVTRVLVAAVQRFDLREADFAAVIDGMRTDAETVIVAPDLATLDLYCDRVASAVGRLSVRAFGDSSDDADKVAYSLGRALQLTNILRDLKEDADRGRLYLPVEYLDREGVPHDPTAALASEALSRVCARLAQDARRHFEVAKTHMERCDPIAMNPAWLMGETYAAILSELERGGWRDPTKRIGLPLRRKIWLLIRYKIHHSRARERSAR
jgi:phytoene synthase